jgi:hypothetical protein
MNVIMKTTAKTTTQVSAKPWVAPTWVLVVMLPGPMTTQAMISPGPSRWNHLRWDVVELFMGV